MATLEEWTEVRPKVLNEIRAHDKQSPQYRPGAKPWSNASQAVGKISKPSNVGGAVIFHGIGKRHSSGKSLGDDTVDNYCGPIKLALESLSRGDDGRAKSQRLALLPKYHLFRGGVPTGTDEPDDVESEYEELQATLPAALRSEPQWVTANWFILVVENEPPGDWSMSPDIKSDAGASQRVRPNRDERTKDTLFSELLGEIGINDCHNGFSFENFVKGEAADCRDVFILQNALPGHDASRQLFADTAKKRDVRIVMYHPTRNPFLAEREKEIFLDNPFWLRLRIYGSLENVIEWSGKRLGSKGNIHVRLTAERIPYVLYGTDKRIYAGFLLPGIQSNETPQLVAEGGSPAYKAFRDYFDYFWNHLCGGPIPRAGGEDVSGKSMEELFPEKQALLRRLRRSNTMSNVEIHVGIAGKDAAKFADRLRHSDWDTTAVTGTTAGNDGEHDAGHIVIRRLCSREFDTFEECLPVVEEVGSELGSAPDEVLIEVEQVLWEWERDPSHPLGGPPKDFNDEVPPPVQGKLQHVRVAKHDHRFEAHFSFKTAEAKIESEFVRAAYVGAGVRYAEVSWMREGNKAIATRFYKTYSSMCEDCRRVQTAMHEYLSGIEGGHQVGFKITAEQVLLCGQPKKRRAP